MKERAAVFGGSLSGIRMSERFIQVADRIVYGRKCVENLFRFCFVHCAKCSYV